MGVNHELIRHGFGASSSGGGCMWYTKEIQYKEKDAFVAITDVGGLALPDSLDEPVLVGIYDLDSGDLFDEVQTFESLRSYLASLNSSPED